MKKISNILKYPVMLIVYVLLFVLLDQLFSDVSERSIINYCAPALAFITAILLGELAEKHGWDTWSGLISRLKKKK